MIFAAETRRAIVARANLAPSVHNTQPARWRFEDDGTIMVLADETRFLAVGDPSGRDAALSCGTAVEGTIMALGDHGFSTTHVEDIWQVGPVTGGLRPAARIVPGEDGKPSELSDAVDARFTWRGRFEPANDSMRKDLTTWATARDDVALAASRADLEMLAALNDETSLAFFRRDDYRGELLHWMRLTRSHPDYDLDGLNLDALHMGPLEGRAARRMLGTPALFRLLDLAHVAAPMMAERGRTLSATAIALFHRPMEEAPVETGRVFYRMWLELARMGYAAWPMAVLADDPDSAAACAERFGIGEDRRLVNLLRVGIASGPVMRARRKSPDLIVGSTD